MKKKRRINLFNIIIFLCLEILLNNLKLNLSRTCVILLLS